MFMFRFEFLWPFWLLLRSVHDSFKYKGLVSVFTIYFDLVSKKNTINISIFVYINVFIIICICFQAFSVLFVCIAITSDLVCLFFIPVNWLLFAASTYVWVQYVWHTGKLIINIDTICIRTYFYLGYFVRLACSKYFTFCCLIYKLLFVIRIITVSLSCT